MKKIENLNLENKKVFIRTDMSVPLDDAQKITDDNRIKESVATINYVVEKKGIPVITTHLGRPEGTKNLAFSVKPVAARLEELLGKKVTFVSDCIGSEVEKIVAQAKPGDVILLENLRFYNEETSNNLEFAKKLAKLADVYINDAFAVCHREHASVCAIAGLFEEKAPGFLLQKELDFYEKTLVTPKRPFCVVLGGSKISTKLSILNNISEKADKIIIGGAMANTFLAAQGIQVGRSLYEPDMFNTAIQIMAKLSKRGCSLYLPVDFKVGTSIKGKALSKNVTAQEIPADTMALDIGPATASLYETALNNVETVIFNGPMGAFENEDFADGTHSMIRALGSATGLTVAGGGDTVAAINQMELGHKFDYISTGGGAFLALLEGQTLPAVKALG